MVCRMSGVQEIEDNVKYDIVLVEMTDREDLSEKAHMAVAYVLFDEEIKRISGGLEPDANMKHLAQDEATRKAYEMSGNLPATLKRSVSLKEALFFKERLAGYGVTVVPVENQGDGYPVRNDTRQKKTKMKTPLLVLIAGGLVAVLVIATVVFMIWNNKDDDGATDNMHQPFEEEDEADSSSERQPLTGQNIQWQTVSSGGISIDIPSTWTYKISDDGLYDINITSEDGSISIFVGYMIAGDPHDYVSQNPFQSFRFNDGNTGYMFEQTDDILWVNPGIQLCCGMSINFGDNRSVFTDNEDLILRIARSLRSRPEEGSLNDPEAFSSSIEDLYGIMMYSGESLCIEMHWDDERISFIQRNPETQEWMIDDRDANREMILPIFSIERNTLIITFDASPSDYIFFPDHTGVYGDESFSWYFVAD